LKLYRINKLSGPGGSVVKKKDIIAASDRDAVKRAADSEDCPVCDILNTANRSGW
jgi:hypothetical protein